MTTEDATQVLVGDLLPGNCFTREGTLAVYVVTSFRSNGRDGETLCVVVATGRCDYFHNSEAVVPYCNKYHNSLLTQHPAGEGGK